MRIVATEVVEEHWNLEADRALQVTLAVCGADEPVCDMVVVSGLRTLRFTFYELVTADVAPSAIIVFPLAGGHSGASSLYLSELSLRFPLPTQ